MRAIADGLLWTECTDSWYGRFVAKVDKRLNGLIRWRQVGREAAVVKTRCARIAEAEAG
jgi:hypothetical protein